MKSICLAYLFFASAWSLSAQTSIPAKTTVEVEGQPLVSFGATVRKVTDIHASGGAVEFLDSTAPGQAMEITTPVLPATRYELQLRYKANTTRGIVNVSIDGNSPQDFSLNGLDQFGPAGYKTVTLGHVVFSAPGKHVIRMTVTQKTDASSGYVVTGDAFVFIPQPSIDVGSSVSFTTRGSGPFMVSMTPFPSDAAIHYTTDGTTPSPVHGTLYTGPISIVAPRTLSANAFKQGFDNSSVATISYSTQPGFSLSPLHVVLTAVEGESETALLELTPLNGLTGPVTFSTIGLEGTATASFEPVVLAGTPVTTPVTIGALPAGRDLLGQPIEVIARCGTASQQILVSLRNLKRRPGEAEDLPRFAGGAPLTVHDDLNTSGAKWISLDALSGSAFAEFTLPNLPGGTYAFKLNYLAGPNRGIATFTVDNVPLGGALDQYAEAPAYLDKNFGTLSFANAGSHVMRLTVAGKNPASTGFTLSADRFVLPPTITVEPETLSLTSASSTPITISSDPRATGGRVVFLNAKGVGDSLELLTPSLDEGTYRVKLRYKADVDRGIVVITVDGKDFESLDQHSSTPGYVTADLGLVTFIGNRPQVLTMSLQDKNPASKKFTATIDSIIFAGQ